MWCRLEAAQQLTWAAARRCARARARPPCIKVAPSDGMCVVGVGSGVGDAHLGGSAAASARTGADTVRGTASSSSATRALEPPSMSAAPAHRSLAHFLAPGAAAGGKAAMCSRWRSLSSHATKLVAGAALHAGRARPAVRAAGPRCTRARSRGPSDNTPMHAEQRRAARSHPDSRRHATATGRSPLNDTCRPAVTAKSRTSISCQESGTTHAAL